MKNIRIIFITLLSMIMLSVAAQETQKQQLVIPLSNPDKTGHLEIGGINCNIIVTGYNGKEVIIDAFSKNGVTNITETKNGMKKINASSMSIEAEEKDNKIDVSTGFNTNGITFEVKVPYNFSLDLSTVNDGIIKVDNVNGEISASNVNGPITLNKVSGSVSATTINDDILISFEKVNPNKAMAFSSLNGNVDISFPASIKANVKIKCDRGEILTDFDVDLNKERKVNNEKNKRGVYKVSIDEWVYGKINGGGPEYTFKNFNGDIIIREK